MPSRTLCCVVWCRNSSLKTRFPDCKCFAVPKNDFIGNKWKDWIEKENFRCKRTLKHPSLCSDHFSKEFILQTGKLVPGTVPTRGKKSKDQACAETTVDGGNPVSGINLSTLLEGIAPLCHAFSVKTGQPSWLYLDNKENTPNSINACSTAPLTISCPVLPSGSGVQISGGITLSDMLASDACVQSNKEPLVEPMQEEILEETRAAVSASPPQHAMVPDSMETPQRKGKRKRPSDRYVGDLSPSDFCTPTRAAKNLDLAKRSNVALRKKLKVEQNRRYRLESKVKSLESLVKHLKDDKKMIDERAAAELESALPGAGAKLFERAVRAKRGAFCSELREFALTLHFYSPSAYNYVRKTFLNCLPHERTLIKWYVHVEAEPGFTKCSLEAIRKMSDESKEQSKKLVVALSMDEMHVKTKIERVQDKVYGYPDLGFGEINENGPPASKALVFMATAINRSWKITVGYFFVHSLDGKQRASLLKNCVNLVLDTGAEIASITFDGDPVNCTAASCLGASLDPIGDWRPHIIVDRPSGRDTQKQKIEIMLDAVHMIKLVRNALADPQVEIFDKFGNKIEWKFLELLNECQLKEGLCAANKIKRRHLRFFNEKQKVKLAVH